MKLSVIAALVMSSALGGCGKKMDIETSSPAPAPAPAPAPVYTNAEALQNLYFIYTTPNVVAIEFTPATDTTMKCVTIVSTYGPTASAATCWKKSPPVPQ